MPPKEISHYRVVRRLGSGGMGEVFLAEDTKLDRSVALKLLPKEVAEDASRRKRFIAEAKAASALNHSSVCTIYEVGETAEGQPFIAMEYLDGQTLDALARRRLELGKIVGIGAQVAEALEAARQHQVVHRDIKPGNIMVDSQGRVKVLDFGLAKRLDRPADASNVTQEGAIVGTPNYLSPELALGREVDSRSDIFSLGVVLYELAARQNPFAGASFGGTVNNILNKDPEPLKPWNPNVTPEFERILSKCLEKDASKRYATPQELAADLRQLEATQDGRDGHNGKAVWMLATAGVTACLLTLIAWQFLRPTRPAADPGKTPGAAQTNRAPTALSRQRLVLLPFKSLASGEANEIFTEGLAVELFSRLSRIRGLQVIDGSGFVKAQGAEKDFAAKWRELNAGVLLKGTVLKEEKQLRIRLQLLDSQSQEVLKTFDFDREPESVLALYSEAAEVIASALQVQLLAEERLQIARKPTENPRAYQLYLEGRAFWNRRTGKDITNAIARFNQAIAEDPAYALAYAGLADCYQVLPLYRQAGAREAEAKARAAALRALELDPQLVGPIVVLASLKENYHYDWYGAEADYLRAIGLDPNYATARQWFAEMLSLLGRFEEAEKEARKAVELDPLAPVIHAALAKVLTEAGRTDEAVDLLRKQITSDPSFGLAHALLGKAYVARDNFSDAISECEAAVRLGVGWALGDLGFSYGRAGKTDDARKILQQLVEARRQGGDVAVLVAQVHHGMGNDLQALETLEMAASEHSALLHAIAWGPCWKDIRPTSRFQAILRKMNLVPASASEAPAAAPPKSVAVLPFVNLSADKSDEYLADGISEDLSIALTQVRELRVPAWPSCRAFKAKTEDLRNIGRLLSVATLLEGSVTKAGSKLRVNVRLSDVVNQTQLWATNYDCEMTNILDIRRDIAQQVVEALKVQLRVEETRALVKKPTDNAEAYALCIQARSWSDQATSEGFTNALKLYQRAVALDPGYALAYAGMASAYTMVSDWLLPTRTAMEAAKTNAETALRLDESLAQAHVVLGYIRGDYEWNHDGQKQEYERALVLAPNLADAYLRYGSYLRHMKRFEEARVAFKRALELDPVSPITQSALAYVDFLARDYPKSLELSRATTAQFPSSVWGHIRLAYVCEQLGRHEEAISEMARVRSIEDSPDLIARLAHMNASAGQTNEVLKLEKELEDWQKRAYVSPTFFAWVHLGMGRTNEAISRLQEAVELRDGFLTELNSDPYYDPLRADPRFIALVRKIGLPP